MKELEHSDKNKTCRDCPAVIIKGNLDLGGCGQSKKKISKESNKHTLAECKRRPQLGHFEPSLTFEQCPKWKKTKDGYELKCKD